MIMNIEILIKLKEYIDKYSFLIDDIEVRCQTEDEPLDELISKSDEDIIEILNVIAAIDSLLNALTVDIRDSMSIVGGFDCDDYHTWVNHLKHDVMHFDGLCETFTASMEQLEDYVMETLRGYRILTQPAYDQTVFYVLEQNENSERGTE